MFNYYQDENVAATRSSNHLVKVVIVIVTVIGAGVGNLQFWCFFSSSELTVS